MAVLGRPWPQYEVYSASDAREAASCEAVIEDETGVGLVWVTCPKLRLERVWQDAVFGTTGFGQDESPCLACALNLR